MSSKASAKNELIRNGGASNKVLFIGLDACDPALAARLASEGHLPAIRGLFERASRCPIENPYGLFVGALWMSFATATGPVRHGFSCWEEVEVETYTHRLTQPPSAAHTFWEKIGEAGRTVVALDVPHTRVARPINGIQTVEWGCHDRHFGFHTWPPSLTQEIESDYGLHPIFGTDAYAVREFAADDYVLREGMFRTCDEDRDLIAGLLAGLDAKRRMSRDLYARGPWDLFITVFGESHAVGHQQWHLHDTTHVRHDHTHVRATNGDPLLQVYKALDAAVGDLLASTDDDTTVMLLLSHGMGPHHDGTHLLDEVLRRIDAFDSRTRDHASFSRYPRQLAAKLPGRMQRRAFACATPMMRVRNRHRTLGVAAHYATTEARRSQEFFMAMNNSVYGGVRFNMVGREPAGVVERGELDATMDALANDLYALVNVATGRSVVRHVARTDAHYARGSSDTLPDLFVEWERDALIETVWSAKTGTVHTPYTHWRTGDHREHGLLLCTGPGLTPGPVPAIRVEDIGPTIASRLGLHIAEAEGLPAPWLRAT